MPYVEHTQVKPEKIAATAAVAIDTEAVLPNVFQKESFDAYKGTEGDSVTIRVEGVLPWRTYPWRNDRSQPIEFDRYSERKYSVSLAGQKYSAVQLTDEQYNMDFNGWSKLVVKQGEAVGRGLQWECGQYLTSQDNYDITVGVSDSDIDAGLRRLRRVARGIHMPGWENATLLVGADFEEAILADSRLGLASAVGDQIASTALREATIGRLRGMNVVVSEAIADDEAVLVGQGGFVMANAAPVVPQSVKFGATGSHNGFSTQLIQQYNGHYRMDESVLTTWFGFRTVKDPLYATTPEGQGRISDTEYFVRAVKVKLNGEGGFRSDLSAADKTELSKITGVSEANLTVSGTTSPEPEPPTGG